MARGIFEEIKPEDYLELAEANVRFINTKIKKAPEGITYEINDVPPLGANKAVKDNFYDDITFYAGTAGEVYLNLYLYKITQKKEYLETAVEGGKYLEWRWKNQRGLKRNFSDFAFTTGWAGVSYVLIALYKTTHDEHYKNLASEILDTEIKSAKKSPDGIGWYWSSFNGIVGNAGSVLTLLYAAKALENPEWKEFALEAGRYFLNKGKKQKVGIAYDGVDVSFFSGGDDYVDPNFPMGTAGVGYTLLRLYEESGDKAFLDAVKGIPEYLDSVAVKSKSGAKLLAHGFPKNSDLFFLGYCHGPAGTARFWYKLYKVTGEKKYLDEALSYAQGIIEAGAPEIKSPGYWAHNFCCGTAGIMNTFLGLWAETKDEKWLNYARRCGKVIAGDALRSDEYDPHEPRVPVDPKTLQVKWIFLHRRNPVAATKIGLYDGAAGVSLMLAELYQAEKGTFDVPRAIDDPFPSTLS